MKITYCKVIYLSSKDEGQSLKPSTGQRNVEQEMNKDDQEFPEASGGKSSQVI